MHAALLQQIEPRHHFGGRAIGDDLALAHHDDPIAFAQFFGLMLDHEQTQALLAHPPNQREDFGAPLGIEIAGRLIEYDHAGLQARAPRRSRGAASRRPTATSDRDPRSRASPTAAAPGRSARAISSRGIPTCSIANATSCATLVENSCDSKS